MPDAAPRPPDHAGPAAVAARPVAPDPAAVVAPDPVVAEALPRAGAAAVGEAVSLSAESRRGTLHLVGHAHIDPVWLWQWQEGLAEVRATWRSALDRMREYPEMRFTASSAAFYAWVEDHDPAMLVEIAERVAEGRWELAGGWWVEPDVNIPSGESFVRQALLGQRWFHQRFGRIATVGFNPDGFGHAAGLPQILARTGLPRYVFMRPQVHEADLPRIFRWRGDDGSEVLAFRILWEYGTWTPELDRWVRRCATELGELADDLLVFYGVGDHGGGPTKANLESLRMLEADPDLPALERSTMEGWFERLRPRDGLHAFPAVDGDLQRHAPGCYSAHSGVKRWNRAAESLLGVAERWATVGAVAGGARHATDEVRHAWELVAFNQFHDILAGSAIAPAYEDVRDQLGEAMAIAGRVLNRGVAAIARRVALPDRPGQHLVVANPVVWASRPLVEVETGTGPAGAAAGMAFALEDDEGAAVPVQVVRSEATVRGGRARIAFTADLPSLGYRRYRVHAIPAGDAAGAAVGGCEVGESWLANRVVRVEVDAATGAIRLHDRRSGHDLLGDVGHRAVVMADGYDTWGHGLDRFDRVVGGFEPERVRLVEHGPVLSVLRVVGRFGGSRLVQDVLLRPDDPRVEIRCALTWNERWRALKLRFPVAVTDPEATFEAAYATIRRPTDGREVPGGRWVDVSGAAAVPGGRAGLAVITDSKHGYDVDGPDLGVTALRSPVYAHHEPYLPVAGEELRHQDQGVHGFRVTLVPHRGDWRAAGVTRAAAELHELPIALPESTHAGDLPGSMSFASVAPDHVELRVLKRWEDGEDLVVRLFETAGVGGDAVLELPLLGRVDRITLSPHELVTLVVPLDPAAPLRRVSALEWPEDGPP
jgi:alpha-mannosidase